MEGKPKHAHHGFTHSNHEHHADGSITVHHVHHEGPHKDVKHAVPDLDGAHDSMEDHLGQPNDGEQAASMPPATGLPGGMPPVTPGA
jgi:hypothetical protein